MPDRKDDMIQLELRIQPCHPLFYKNFCPHKTHCDHHLPKLLPWLHQDRMHTHCSHPWNVSFSHFHHDISLNQTVTMSPHRNIYMWKYTAEQFQADDWFFTQKSTDAISGVDHWWLPEKVLTVHWARCIPVQIIDPVSSSLLGCTMIWFNASRRDGTACFKFAFPFTMYPLKYSSTASPDVVLVMGEELVAQPAILVVIVGWGVGIV